MTTAPRNAGNNTNRRLWLALGLVALVGVATAAGWPRDRTPPVDPVRIVAVYPHDPEAFCQGLVFANGVLYEGTGQYGASSLRQIDLATGQIQRQIPLDQSYFGEGITVWGDKLYQLTWKNRLAIVYDLSTLTPVSSFRYSGEGWGLTTDGTWLIMSDGTSTLRFLDPKTFEVRRRLTVRTKAGEVDQLNELEFVEGEIYANIWYSDRIARISPKSGEVLGWLDLSQLWPQRQRPSREHVLNGIAYDAAQKRLFVTGKYWPRLYEIEVLPRR
uniref:Glutaminyl-peptide cyclotransferase n=1 Tax=Schlesneria paludicola TaxID=360056 RepID=A0A7C4QNC3_9PLAN